MAKRTYALAVEVAERLQLARAAAGMTIAQLAKAAQLDQNTVDHLLAGKVRNPGIGTIADLAKALGVRPEWLAYGRGRGPAVSDGRKPKA